ncbi:TatD family hydrolase [Mesomycoplasma neurolyticum]|uniref:TatD DNase family protein n=1 Tax=Mesomycoplasma neurolyticum TaxID=2120 RepID=A0A449A5M3_9BACT|nr:TatD family hydrolase [Mesomycoplasma neurolyticum]VEU59555.1 TatD DNase family protein [Mesomycoplasma neurolyticum]
MSYLKLIKISKEFTNKLINCNFNYKKFQLFDKNISFKNSAELIQFVISTNKKNNKDNSFYIFLDNDNFYEQAIALIHVKNNEKFEFIVNWNYDYQNVNFQKNLLNFIFKLAKEKFNKKEIIWIEKGKHIFSEIKNYFYFQKYENKILIQSKKNKKNLNDIHFHPFKEYYKNPTYEIEKSYEKGLEKIFFVSCSWKEIDEIESEIQKHNNLFPVFGIHPSNVKKEDNFYLLEKKIHSKVVAIGEIGLDYHHPKNPEKSIQKWAFEQQLDVGLKFNLPIILHVREAFEDVYKIITKNKYKNLKFIFHTYSGNLEWTKKLLNHKNFYFSFSGVITYKKNVETRKLIRLIPNDKIFSETDAPYLTPEEHRSKINHAYYVNYVVETIALAKNIEYNKMLQIISENIKKVFGV